MAVSAFQTDCGSAFVMAWNCSLANAGMGCLPGGWRSGLSYVPAAGPVRSYATSQTRLKYGVKLEQSRQTNHLLAWLR